MSLLVLLVLLFTHAVNPESAPSHLGGGYAAGVVSAGHGGAAGAPCGAGDGRHGGHGGGHAVETCALGQPQPGPQAPLPVRAELGSVVRVAAVPPVFVAAAIGGFVVPIPHAAQSAVLRL